MRWLTLSLEAMILAYSQPIYRKEWRNIGRKMTQVLFDIVMKSYFKSCCSTTQKRRKLVTRTHRKFYSSPEPQLRSSWQKLALFFSFTNLCLLFHLYSRLMCTDTTTCAHFLVKKGICDWKHAIERLSSHEQSNGTYRCHNYV